MREKYPDIKIFYYYTQEIFPAIREMGQKYNLTLGEIGVHAGDMEASEMLYLASDIVNKDRLVEGYTEMITNRIRKKYKAEGLNSISETGVLGDQRKASYEKGKDYIEKFTGVVLPYIRKQLES